MNYMNLMVSKFDVNSNKEAIKDDLRNLCDEDYNGNNGIDYFVENHRGKLVSRFDYAWDKNKNLSMKETISKILTDNYKDDYYLSYDLKLTEVENIIVVSLSYVH